jgi:hypothetical protein
MSDPARPLRGPELLAVAALWKRTGREITARFTGRSMEPTLASGAEVRLRCGDAPAVGDVIAFIRDGHLVLHRVEALSTEAGWVLTRGDACLFPDPPLYDATLILGRAISRLGPAPGGWGRRGVLALCRLLMRHRAGAAVVARMRYLALLGRRPLRAAPDVHEQQQQRQAGEEVAQREERAQVEGRGGGHQQPGGAAREDRERKR